MRHFLSTPSCHTRARPNARQKSGSKNVSSRVTRQVDVVSLRVQAAPSRCAPAESVSMPSDPCLWYPPSVAFLRTSAIVTCVLLVPCGGMEEKSLILHRYLKMTVLLHKRVEANCTLPPL